MKPGKTGLIRIVHATMYSCKGFKAAWINEAAFRQELIMLIILSCVALVLPITAFEKVFLLIAMLQVIVVELLNSAVEAVVDRIGAEMHELSGRAKDMASAAVTVSLSIALISWIYIIVTLL